MAQHTSTLTSAPKALKHFRPGLLLAGIVQAVLACFSLSSRSPSDVIWVSATVTLAMAYCSRSFGRHVAPWWTSAVVGHAVGMAVLILSGVLGELSSGGAIKWIHVVLGCRHCDRVARPTAPIGKNPSDRGWR